MSRFVIIILIIIFSIFECGNNSFSQTVPSNNVADSLNDILKTADADACECLQVNKTQGDKIVENNPVIALDYYNYALVYLDSCENFSVRAELYKKIGNIFYDVNEYEKALPNFLQSTQFYYRINELENAVDVLDILSNIYLDMNMHSNALSTLNKAYYFYSKDPIKYKTKLMVNNMNIGVAYGLQSSLDSSLHFFKKAISYASTEENPIEYGGLLNNIGAIYSKMEENDTAFKYYTEAYKLFESMDYPKGMGISLGNIAYLKQKQEKYKEAIADYLLAIKYVIKGKSPYHLLNIYENLSDSYKSVGQFDDALLYSEKYHTLQDSISSIDRINNLLKIETQYKIAQKDNELKLLEKEKQLIEKDNKMKETRQYFLIGGLLLFLFLGILVYRNLRISIKNIRLKQELLTQEKKQIEIELEFKNKDLENFALRIVEKNEFLDSLKKEIAALRGADEDIKRLLNISNSIRNNQAIENDAFELENKINQIYKGFVEKLKSSFPELTKTEKRLCTLMVLDLSSKDIASIMNITPESVKKGRYRLRKKLNLESEDDIKSFLKTL